MNNEHIVLHLYNEMILNKMGQLFLHAEAWLYLKSIVQSERSQTPKTAHYNMISLNEILKGQNYNHAN